MKEISFLLILILLLASCKDDEVGDDGQVPGTVMCEDLTSIPFNPSLKEIILPKRYQPIVQPLGDEMTDEGVLLGRFLFYDPILSVDSSMSCSSCHGIGGNFTDNLKTSIGVDGIAGTRSSMALVDLIYAEDNGKGLFWDGRVKTLEEQALLPVEDPIELHDTWENVEEKLKRSERYPAMFREAFGIRENCDITKELASKAIAQFERSLITMGNSEYDRVRFNNDGFFSDSAERGFQLFFDEDDNGITVPDAECFHCHGGPLFTDNSFRNNGLTFFTDETAMDIADKGLYEVTKDVNDIGLFRVPTLRNIEFSAPYMHDGRFETLEEVLDHYVCEIQQSPTLHPLIFNHCDSTDELTFISEQDKKDIIAFLKTLSDTTFFTNPDYQSPF